LRTSFGWE